MVAKPHALIDAPGAVVVLHEMEEWYFTTLQLKTNEHFDEATRKPATLKVRMGTYAAYFTQATRSHTLSRNRNQSLTLEYTVVITEFDRSFGKGAWMRNCYQLKDLRHMPRAKLDSGKCYVWRG
jgi:hypothetical protein